MSLVYDYEIAPHHDHLVELFERGNSLALEGLTPETASVVAAFPFRSWLSCSVLILVGSETL
jgi:hypothetical protein